MYPLKLELPAGEGYAVANDEAEHIELSKAGYLPAFVPVAKADKRSKAE